MTPGAADPGRRPGSAVPGGLPNAPPHDSAFAASVADRLAGLPGVGAVTLGGSRAVGTQRPDSDWDFAVYYRGGAFDPADLRAVGWPGEVSEIGGWGGGVMNGGGWMEVDGRHVDVIYRDLDDVEHHLAEARAGRFRIENLLGYLAGVPTYLVVAELAGHLVLHGELPRPAYPDALREAAPAQWFGRARFSLDYGRGAYAVRGHTLAAAGAAARAAAETAHGILAARGEWVVNEKRILDRAGLRGVDALAFGAGTGTGAFDFDRVDAVLRAAMVG
jgi:predicted nucleotidyltransferase